MSITFARFSIEKHKRTQPTVGQRFDSSLPKATLTAGHCFGELPLLQLRPHEHSVVAMD